MKVVSNWSLKDYHSMIEAGIFNNRRVELLNGKIIEMSPEGPLHRYTNVTIAKYLRRLLGNNAEIYEAHPITLSSSEPEPDIAVVKTPDSRYRSRRDPLRGARHPYPEDIYWLIEISDTTLSYDLGDKKLAYARALVREYWVVDINALKLTIFRQPQGDDYQTQTECTAGTVSPLAFPDVAIDINEIFQR